MAFEKRLPKCHSDHWPLSPRAERKGQPYAGSAAEKTQKWFAELNWRIELIDVNMDMWYCNTSVYCSSDNDVMVFTCSVQVHWSLKWSISISFDNYVTLHEHFQQWYANKENRKNIVWSGGIVYSSNQSSDFTSHNDFCKENLIIYLWWYQIMLKMLKVVEKQVFIANVINLLVLWLWRF